MNSIRISVLLVLFIPLLFIKAYAADGFKNGEQVNVWAVDGLPLQQEASKAEKSIAIIPYGQRVTVLGYDKTKLGVSIKTSNSDPELQLALKGNWIKVSYKDKQGYVFDGYLSKMSPFIKSKNSHFESEEDYLKRNYGIARINDIKGKEGFRKITTYYKNGNVSIETFFDGCSDSELLLKNISYKDALLFEQVILIDADATQDLKINKVKDMIKITCYSCD